MNKQPLIIAGPSGSGKTYLTERLAEQYPLKLVLSSMTRPPRAHEQQMVDNEFLSDAAFDQASNSGDFFMVNEFFGHRYGYRRSFVSQLQQQEQVPMAIVYTPIVGQFLAAYPDSYCVFLLPQSEELLIERMRRRGDEEVQIAKRLESIEQEVAAYQRQAELFQLTAKISSDADIEPVITHIAKQYQVHQSQGG